MPVITVSCLPMQSEKSLKTLSDAIVAATVAVEELGLKGEEDITVLFPVDMRSHDLGSDIIVMVDGLLGSPERTEKVRNQLAESLGNTLRTYSPEARVECFVKPFRPEQGFWSSEDSA